MATIGFGGVINLASGVEHPGRLVLFMVGAYVVLLLIPPILVGRTVGQRAVADASIIVWREFFRQRKRLWLSATASGALIGVAAGLAGWPAGVVVALLGLAAGYLAFKTGLALPPPRGGNHKA